MSFDLEAFRSTVLPKQTEIMARWSDATPLVSIICFTYNQELYIHDAIRGFLTQETNFPFEVIIHDDASTDSTPKLIQAYAKRYPAIVKPVLQRENQYSKSPNSIFPFAINAATGAYFAFCEGDDFWITPKKLQIQIDSLKEYPEQFICFHNSYADCIDGQINQFYASWKKTIIYPNKPSIVSTREVIIGGGGYMPSASIMVRRSAVDNLPEWYVDCPVGDYFLQVLCSHPNGALFLPQLMSFYRIGTVGSWSATTMIIEDNKIAHYRKTARSLDMMCRHLGNKYASSIARMQIDGALYLLADSTLSLSSKTCILRLAPKNPMLNLLAWLIKLADGTSPTVFQRLLYFVKYFAIGYRIQYYFIRNLLRGVFHPRNN